MCKKSTLKAIYKASHIKKNFKKQPYHKKKISNVNKEALNFPVIKTKKNRYLRHKITKNLLNYDTKIIPEESFNGAYKNYLLKIIYSKLLVPKKLHINSFQKMHSETTHQKLTQNYSFKIVYSTIY